MNTSRLNRSLALVAALAAMSVGTLHAQQPGGRGGAAPALNPAQTAALSQAVVPPALSQAATTAATDLTRASLAQPADAAAVSAAAAKLAEAELALALSRADEFAKAQALLKPISVAQAQAALGRAGGGGRGALTPDTNDGFTALFNGRDLSNWDFDPKFWRVENGVIVAETTADNVLRSNTFLIWKDGKPRDFEFKVDYRFATGGGNSGVQFRSRPSGPQGEDQRQWGISGPQMDMVAAGGTGSGVFYSEGGGFGLLPQAAVVRATDAGNRQIATVGTGVADAIKPSPEWNTYHIIARQNVIIAIINGRVTTVLVDDARSGAAYAQEGLLALQMHTGAPFRLEFRNVLLKEIKPENLTPTPAPAAAGRGGRGGQ